MTAAGRPRVLAALTALLLAGAAFGHAQLSGSEPEANSTVAAPPEQVVLHFTEAVEVAFSVFKVYRLDAEADMEEENAWQRLNGLASLMVPDALAAKEDAPGRVDEGVQGGDARTAEVVIGLPDDLAPGVYVVMWRVLSVDTHTTQGFLLFSYAPADAAP